MKQGEIWYANLSPVEGSEQSGFRPVIIVSGNLLNTNAQVLVCCPLTSKLKRYAGNPVLEPSTINGLLVESEVMVLHIRSLSKGRLKKQIGKAEPWVIPMVKETLNDMLNF